MNIPESVESMSNGMIYNCANPELEAVRSRAKDLFFQFNNLNLNNHEARSQIIRELFGKCCEKFRIEGRLYVDYGCNIEVGENFYANDNLVILDAAKVKIGNNVFLGPNVGIYTSGHPIDVERRNKCYEYALPITIGDNVWIGGGVHIVPGVTIGNNSVIGTGSVVTKDIPPNVIAVGNPCRVLREVNETDAAQQCFVKP